VPAPYGKLTVSAPSNFSVFVDGKPFESGTVAAGRHVVEAKYRNLVLMKQDVYVKPEENTRVNFSAEGLLLYGPPNSYFAVKTAGVGWCAISRSWVSTHQKLWKK